MFDYQSPRLFHLSNQLPIPLKFNPSGNLPLEETSELAGNIDIYTNEANSLEARELAFEGIVTSINKITNTKLIPAWGDDINDKRYLEFLDVHFNTRMNSRKLNDALKNKTYYIMWESGTNLRNWIALTTPISMGDARTKADSSTAGEFSKLLSNTNPATIAVSQHLNSIGKASIGINATGIKVWSLVLTYFHDKLSKASSSEQLLDLTSYKKSPNGTKEDLVGYDNKGDTIKLILAGIVPNINWEYVNSHGFLTDLQEKYTNYKNIPEDVYVLVSVLLSASTDFQQR